MGAGLTELGEGHEGVSRLDLGFHAEDSFERFWTKTQSPDSLRRSGLRRFLLAWERLAYAICRSPRIVPVTRCHESPDSDREIIEAHDTASAIAGAHWVVKKATEEIIVVLGGLIEIEV